MSRILGLVESPAQLLNALEWAYAAGVRETARLVIAGPTDPTTRLQLHRLAELARADGFSVAWSEVRGSATQRARALAALAGLVRDADTLVLGDPYSGIAHLLLNSTRFTRGEPRIVVVDDGTATLHYEQQWVSAEPLQRWHLEGRSHLARLVGGRAHQLLGRGSEAVELFTAMPIRTRIPAVRNSYAWTRERFGPPEVLDGIDLLGSSLAETGTIAEPAYLAGVRRLVSAHGLRRYLPHRKESAAKLAAIAAMGVEIVRPDLPVEVYARRGPVARELWSFPSTVLHTLPIVLADTGVGVRPLAVAEDWFSAEADQVARGFIAGI
ncbi:hypothetical protein [Enemella evansiae]|uniref:hypothetical protein n=1 Tax=Enemella evansiae TaxID=2016499 RepID=UPI000B964621|nr:hypothetical protein [Enemella evansiae]OYO07336.1 hypothetical protein CGZ98_17830 [Enemella evansiae]OYO12352.1 hypothetical protein BI335_14125 [Enemella evansiae]TDO93238.1 hypothetical protein C8D81_1018 [Enemella evansiae]